MRRQTYEQTTTEFVFGLQDLKMALHTVIREKTGGEYLGELQDLTFITGEEEPIAEIRVFYIRQKDVNRSETELP